MTPLNSGDQFAGYTIERLLGAGGMGEVYLAQHPRLPRRDALKILNSSLAANADFRARFEREADTLAELRHPNIVRVHDRGETDGHLWIALEYIDGPDLAAVIERGPMPIDQIARVVAQVADALDASARRGLVHRDVKPANVLLAGDGRALLTDFGIARAADEVSELTGTGTMIGTVAFAAPEQLQALPVDARADQYSLACTAFALLTGHGPYTAATPTAMVLAHVQDASPALSARRPGLHPTVDQVFYRALAKNPADRYATSGEFAAALSQSLTAPKATPSAAPHHTQRTQGFTPDPQSKRSKRVPLIVGGLVVVAALVTGLALWLTDHDDGRYTSEAFVEFDPSMPTELSPEAATLERKLVSPNLASLDAAPRQAMWSWTPPGDGTNAAIIGGTEKYALGGVAGDDGVRLAVLDAESGRTVASITIPDLPRELPRRCQVFDGTQVLFCEVASYIGDDSRQMAFAAIDLERGTASRPQITGISAHWFVTGDRAVVDDDQGLHAFDIAGRPAWQAPGIHSDSFNSVHGAPVVGTDDDGVLTLRSVRTGRIVHTSKDSGDLDPTWAPFLGGFVVADGDDAVIYDADGKKLSTAAGRKPIAYENAALNTVTPLPILRNAAALGAANPATGTMLWERPVSVWRHSGGVGTAFAFALPHSSGAAPEEPVGQYWLDCYTGVGGKFTATSSFPVGTDGVRFAATTQAMQRLHSFAPDGRLLWELVPTDPSVALIEYHAHGGKIYQANRRVL
ncbi:MAG: protein kinase [Gordonia sp. (in: high G+C Gram-positive bacteria)]|uniref:serine/threonine-protein kinase n=1 Tax=Gordonia sp. (in: high G+C Gram-positive bacteria) TaxID=84139 RepID=UPI003BB71433